ncbi:NUDIX domain-containing protein [Nocardia elegans]|uniref:NUDIX domain-containing protein n=1 Tax=Nocardia elegans TaxID=300029 RepID=A0ABW6TE72_9NOCA|nr:NUDIX domain-containing protein [Nocardia elegans]MBF6446578.1 NUDIX domain-containing protein [Nocardia elegans]
MAKLSAGLLLYRIGRANSLEVLIVHMGGPFWAKKDAQGWSIPKGEYDDGEDPLVVAEREFSEELGRPSPGGETLALDVLKQPSGKKITAFARQGEFDASNIESNTFEMEWPRGSGKLAEFPEVDRAEWYDIDTARVKLVKGQVPFLDRLIEALKERNVKFSLASTVAEPPNQVSLF